MNSGTIMGYFLQAVPITLIAGLIYTIIRARAVSKRRLKVEWISEIIKLLFVCYLTGLVSLVILPANFWLQIFDGIFLGWWDQLRPVFSLGAFNLVPSLIKALSGELTLGSWVKTMLIGNVAMFVPLGFFLPFVTKRINKKNIFALAAIIPICAELLQLIFGRSFDVDDLICNFLGIMIGFFVGTAIKHIIIDKRKAKKRIRYE